MLGISPATHHVKDISVNYIWLKPWCKTFPDHIPSGFFMVDCFLALDQFLNGNLLLKERRQECTKEDKIELAREEVKRMKRLLGALRYLWRNGSLSQRECQGGSVEVWPSNPIPKFDLKNKLYSFFPSCLFWL